MEKAIEQAKKNIKNAKTIAIFWHMSPDGDCIGAMLGLWRLLEKQKKKVKYFVPNIPSKIFDFVKNINRLKSRFDYKTYDLLIFVDFTWINRMWIIGQANPEYFKDKNILTFDHHPGGEIENSIMIKDVKSISACEIIFEQTYKRRPELYDKEIATYFYLGIMTDSGNFLFEEDHIRTFSNVLKLLKLGADKETIVDNIIRKKSLNSVKFLQVLLGRIKQKNDLLYIYYDEKELEKYKIDTEEAAYALHIIQNIDGPKIILFIRKVGDMIKWSLRAKKITGKIKIDCNKIAKSLWWGGHKLASGFSMPIKGDFQKQITTIIKKIHRGLED